jgi:hypothetical protein
LVENDQTIYYGEETSQNLVPFATALGYVRGSIDSGAEFVFDALAKPRVDAKPATVETEDGDMLQERGRSFDERDANTAQALLVWRLQTP